jgi:hypothetical protein
MERKWIRCTRRFPNDLKAVFVSLPLTGGFFFFSLESLLKLSIAVSDMALRAKVRAAGGKWMPEEQLWYVRYGKISGTVLEKHIQVDTSL